MQSFASQYLQFLGTDKKSSEDISKEFYKIASSFSVMTGEEYTTVTIEGLQENFQKAVELYENLILNAQPDDKALTNLKARIFKSRKDAKLNKGAILQGLTSYAQYGPKNKFNNTISDQEINKITAEELVAKLKTLNQYAQTIIYYGPEKIGKLVSDLKKLHPVPEKFAMPSPAKSFTQIPQSKNQVLFANYDMVQAETRWIRNTEKYDSNKTALVDVFNNYFGGGMGAIVFQTIRESKALAYSTFAKYVSPNKASDEYYMLGYVGSQSDKFIEATTAMNELFNTLPNLPKNLVLSKGQTKKDIETERITQDGIIFNYLAAQQLGLKEDIRKSVYTNVDKITFADLQNLHKKYFSNQPYTYAIVASDKKVKKEDMQKLGELKILSLEEIFGY
jgi:predicted Zn-dependent peptidase